MNISVEGLAQTVLTDKERVNKIQKGLIISATAIACTLHLANLLINMTTPTVQNLHTY